jgi:hypothetical protein
MSDLIDILGKPIKPGNFVLLNRYWGDHYPIYVYKHKALSAYVFTNGYYNANILDNSAHRFLLLNEQMVEEYIQNIGKRLKGWHNYATNHHIKFLKEHLNRCRDKL